MGGEQILSKKREERFWKLIWMQRYSEAGSEMVRVGRGII